MYIYVTVGLSSSLGTSCNQAADVRTIISPRAVKNPTDIISSPLQISNPTSASMAELTGKPLKVLSDNHQNQFYVLKPQQQRVTDSGGNSVCVLVANKTSSACAEKDTRQIVVLNQNPQSNVKFHGTRRNIGGSLCHVTAAVSSTLAGSTTTDNGTEFQEDGKSYLVVQPVTQTYGAMHKGKAFQQQNILSTTIPTVTKPLTSFSIPVQQSVKAEHQNPNVQILHVVNAATQTTSPYTVLPSNCRLLSSNASIQPGKATVYKTESSNEKSSDFHHVAGHNEDLNLNGVASKKQKQQPAFEVTNFLTDFVRLPKVTKLQQPSNHNQEATHWSFDTSAVHWTPEVHPALSSLSSLIPKEHTQDKTTKMTHQEYCNTVISRTTVVATTQNTSDVTPFINTIPTSSSSPGKHRNINHEMFLPSANQGGTYPKGNRGQSLLSGKVTAKSGNMENAPGESIEHPVQANHSGEQVSSGTSVSVAQSLTARPKMLERAEDEQMIDATSVALRRKRNIVLPVRYRNEDEKPVAPLMVVADSNRAKHTKTSAKSKLTSKDSKVKCQKRLKHKAKIKNILTTAARTSEHDYSPLVVSSLSGETVSKFSDEKDDTLNSSAQDYSTLKQPEKSRKQISRVPLQRIDTQRVIADMSSIIDEVEHKKALQRKLPEVLEDNLDCWNLLPTVATTAAENVTFLTSTSNGTNLHLNSTVWQERVAVTTNDMHENPNNNGRKTTLQKVESMLSFLGPTVNLEADPKEPVFNFPEPVQQYDNSCLTIQDELEELLSEISGSSNSQNIDYEVDELQFSDSEFISGDSAGHSTVVQSPYCFDIPNKTLCSTTTHSTYSSGNAESPLCPTTPFTSRQMYSGQVDTKDTQNVFCNTATGHLVDDSAPGQ